MCGTCNKKRNTEVEVKQPEGEGTSQAQVKIPPASTALEIPDKSFAILAEIVSKTIIDTVRLTKKEAFTILKLRVNEWIDIEAKQDE